MQDDLRPLTIFGDPTANAKLANLLDIPNISLVCLPNNGSENLIWIGLFEVDEGKDAILWSRARDRVIGAGLPLSVAAISEALELPIDVRLSKSL